MQEVFSSLFGGVLGLCFGSFANVLIFRLHVGASLRGRSKCSVCHTVLQARDLVPLISWLALSKKCRSCNQAISWQYPLVECAALVCGVISASRFSPFGPQAPVFYLELFLLLGLIVLVVMDVRWRELPLELMIGMGLIGSAARLFLAFQTGGTRTVLEGMLVAVVIVMAILGGQWKLSKGQWLGSGDVWFGLMMALILGWPGTGIAIYIAYLLAACVALVLLLTKKVQRGAHLPFAPALAAGMIIVLWFHEPIKGFIERIF